MNFKILFFIFQVELLGYNVDDYSFEEAIIKAKSLIDGDKVSQVVTINPEMFQEAEKNANFSNIIKEAEMVIPDGVGVKIALQITGKKANRIPGIDFAKKLLQEAATSGIPVATVAINGGANAGILAAKILATSDDELLNRIKAYKDELKDGVMKKKDKIEKVGYKKYMEEK